MNPGIVTVRPFQLDDLEAAARFCDAARTLDSSIEPFSQRLPVIATGTRAVLELWRVAEGEDRALYGIAFAAFRESGKFDFYTAVHPALRRQGLGRSLAEAATSSGVALRARVRDDSKPGRAFLGALRFIESAAQLSLQWSARAKPDRQQLPALRIRAAVPRDEPTLARLSAEAWSGAPEAFASRPDEIAQLFGEEGRVVLLAESDGKAMAYLAGVQLGRTLGIEEVAVLPAFRRMGIGRALVLHALRNEEGAVLSVSEANKPARALYKSLGFSQTMRRIVYELRPGEP